ncbi:Rho GTPase activation protein [Phascolomyces articulosus]|uniref:Rho GTPase activation protein n=1 Tax=Phascolomyces articulosus TaxID=60185 RepID=A0AAD5K4N9_9FUNG|nr:Rho GTPase activation protein [Phascolomyces articulosus]
MVLNKPDDYKKGLESPYGDEKPPTTVGVVGDPEARSKDVFAQLTDLDNGFQCLLDKVKHDMQASKDAMLFLRKRAAIEEEYGKQMVKLAQSMSDSFDKAHPRSGTYGDAWTAFLKVHETIGEQRLRFSSDVTEVADDLQLLVKDTEKGRKQVKDVGSKHEKQLTDADLTLEKCKQKYEMHSEEWERAILQKNNDPLHVPKKGLFKNNKTQAQLNKMEEEARVKATMADQNYRQQLQQTNASRQEYFQAHLPKILSSLKDVGDECSVALRYQLARYAYIFEQALTADGLALDNDDGLGLRSLTEKIDKDADLADFIKSYSSRGNSRTYNKSDIPYKEYSMSVTALTVLNPNPVFGVDLNTLMDRDREEVPHILTKCAEAVETYGLNSVGLYRLSGVNTQIQKLRAAFDRDCRGVNLMSEEYISDINNITSVLKLWFRELPDPLFPRSTYQHFLSAAKIEDERMRVLGLHTVINDLPDAHYATLKYLMGHLDKVQQKQRYNKMGSANLATIFGLTLMGNESGVAGNGSIDSQDSERLAETQWQVKVVQTILENYRLIFEPDEP